VTGSSVATLVALPLGLGLLSFVEPCTIGSSLLFIKYIEGRSRAGMVAEVGLFAVTRALFFGALRIAAVVLGTAFLGLQRAGWIALGALYAGFGAIYLAGRAGALMVAAGPSLSRLSELGGSVGLGVLFGFNIPACATPLLVVLFGMAADRLERNSNPGRAPTTLSHASCTTSSARASPTMVRAKRVMAAWWFKTRARKACFSPERTLCSNWLSCTTVSLAR
jgi:hypothetical protein